MDSTLIHASHLRTLACPPRASMSAIQAALLAVAPLVAAGALPPEAADPARREWVRRFAALHDWRIGSAFAIETLAAGRVRRPRGVVVPDGARWLVDHADFFWLGRRPVAVLAHVYPPSIAEAAGAAVALGLAVRPLRFSTYRPEVTTALVVTQNT